MIGNRRYEKHDMPILYLLLHKGFPCGSDGKKICLQCRRSGFNSWVRKIPWRRKWHPTPEFVPGKSHGQRSLVGYSPQGCKELYMTDQLNTFTCWNNSKNIGILCTIWTMLSLQSNKNRYRKEMQECKQLLTVIILDDEKTDVYLFHHSVSLSLYN